MLIAHISDLHIARTPGFRDYNVKRLLGYLNHRFFRGRRHSDAVAESALGRLSQSRPDLVLLTGDITQHGLDAEFSAAADLLSVLTRGGVPVLAMAGNHDVYGDAAPEPLCSLMNTLALGLAPDKYGLFRFPGVELLAVAQSMPNSPFFACGRQNVNELDKAAEAWAEPPRGVMRLVCGHYPAIAAHGGRPSYFRGLRDAGKLIGFCARHGVSGYFCGHDHKRFVAEMPGGCVQYAAPALSAVKDAARERISVYECAPGMAHPLECVSLCSVMR